MPWFWAVVAGLYLFFSLLYAWLAARQGGQPAKRRAVAGGLPGFARGGAAAAVALRLPEPPRRTGGLPGVLPGQ